MHCFYYVCYQNFMNEQPNDILNGITLKKIVTDLVEEFGFEQLSQFINIRCFTNDPSIQSTLKFLRKTPWARTKVEKLYKSFM